jgi:hypothetical protein
MRKLVLASLAIVALVLTASPSEAHGRRRGCASTCAPSCGPALVVVGYEEREVTAYKTEWREKEEKYTIVRLIPREVVDKQKYKVLVPDWKEEERKVTVLTHKPREVVRPVTRCHMVRECVVDPCTGCTYTVCRPHTTVEEVKYTVMDCVPEPRVIKVKVYAPREEERVREIKRIEYDRKPEEHKHTVKYCVSVPYQTKVQVPIYGPACSTPVVVCH